MCCQELPNLVLGVRLCMIPHLSFSQSWAESTHRTWSYGNANDGTFGSLGLDEGRNGILPRCARTRRMLLRLWSFASCSRPSRMDGRKGFEGASGPGDRRSKGWNSTTAVRTLRWSAASLRFPTIRAYRTGSKWYQRGTLAPNAGVPCSFSARSMFFVLTLSLVWLQAH